MASCYEHYLFGHFYFRSQDFKVVHHFEMAILNVVVHKLPVPEMICSRMGPG